nr:putative GTP diphosphokinase RSH1, chloroplastic [Coffea arabica]
MASASCMSVPVECVNVCKLWKGSDVSGRYECSVLSCAWKAPRALTGFLASTAHPSPLQLSTPYRRRYRFTCGCDAVDSGGWYIDKTSPIALVQKLLQLSQPHLHCCKWKLYCSSSMCSESSEEISPGTLWEAVCLKITWKFIFDNIFNAKSVWESKAVHLWEKTSLSVAAQGWNLSSVFWDGRQAAAGLAHCRPKNF